jgi:ATP-dependent Clp protease adaptor protein ClpS
LRPPNRARTMDRRLDLSRMEDPSVSDPKESPGVGTLELEDTETAAALPYFVILFNDDFHSIDEVVLQVQKAAGVSLHQAFEITMEAHSKGKAVCYSGDIDQCEKVAAILREIKLTVEIDHYAGR